MPLLYKGPDKMTQQFQSSASPDPERQASELEIAKEIRQAIATLKFGLEQGRQTPELNQAIETLEKRFAHPAVIESIDLLIALALVVDKSDLHRSDVGFDAVQDYDPAGVGEKIKETLDREHEKFEFEKSLSGESEELDSFLPFSKKVIRLLRKVNQNHRLPAQALLVEQLFSESLLARGIAVCSLAAAPTEKQVIPRLFAAFEDFVDTKAEPTVDQAEQDEDFDDDDRAAALADLLSEGMLPELGPEEVFFKLCELLVRAGAEAAPYLDSLFNAATRLPMDGAGGQYQGVAAGAARRLAKATQTEIKMFYAAQEFVKQNSTKSPFALHFLLRCAQSPYIDHHYELLEAAKNVLSSPAVGDIVISGSDLDGSATESFKTALMLLGELKVRDSRIYATLFELHEAVVDPELKLVLLQSLAELATEQDASSLEKLVLADLKAVIQEHIEEDLEDDVVRDEARNPQVNALASAVAVSSRCKAAFLKLFADKKPQVRVTAASSLGSAPREFAVKVLEELLAKETVTEVVDCALHEIPRLYCYDAKDGLALVDRLLAGPIAVDISSIRPTINETKLIMIHGDHFI